MTNRDEQNILDENKIIGGKQGKLSKEFNPNNLTDLSVDQFVTWDEVQRKFINGSDDGYVQTVYKSHIMKFPHNVNEKLDGSNRTYSREKVTLTNFKYTDEVYLCLGVSVTNPVVDGVNQPQEGRRCKSFVYTGKSLLNMTDFEKKFQNKTSPVKGLKGGHSSG